MRSNSLTGMSLRKKTFVDKNCDKIIIGTGDAKQLKPMQALTDTSFWQAAKNTNFPTSKDWKDGRSTQVTYPRF